MMEHVAKLSELINRCLIPKLPQDFDEEKMHQEVYIHEQYLKDNFQNIIDLMGDVSQKTLPSLLISKLIILYEELMSDGSWSSTQCKQCAHKMDLAFEALYGVGVNSILRSNIFNSQDIFDECIKILHQTVTSESYRKYPSRVEVYCTLVQNDYKLHIYPATVLPLSLLLIDDYDQVIKIKGLKCCLSILLCLNNKSFQDGNFYEVVLRTLLKAVMEKDIEIISLVLENLVQLLKILPEHAKKPAIDKAFGNILNQIMTESNLYRKAACLNFIASLIEMHGINCIIRKSFKTALCDSFDECSNESVAEILLPSCVEVLEIWIQYCWCTWFLSSDHKLLSILFKLLYTIQEESFVTQIQNLIITLIGLCTKKERTGILNSLELTANIKNEEFMKRLQKIKDNLS